MITLNKANPTAGEITASLTNASDSAGLHFDGAAGTYLDIVSPPDLGTSFSFEFIIQADSIKSSGYNYLVDFDTGGRFAIASIDGTLQIYDTDERDFETSFLDDLKVHHLVVTVDGTSAIAYDNGNQVGTATLGATSNIDSCTDARIATKATGTGSEFHGTIYRARFWNKTLTAAEVTTAYENATVNFADQWVGAATNMFTGAADQNWGTPQPDSGNDSDDRTDFNTNYTWNTDGNITDISVASNVLQFTSASSGTSGLWYPTGTLVAGKRYRIIIRTGAITGGDFKVRVTTGSYVDLATLTASSTNVIDFIAPKSVANYIYINTSDAGATIQLNAASVSNELFRAGVVADYDLAFANPTQSDQVQDRAGAADGTASATGVTQVTPIEQLNAKELVVSGIAFQSATTGSGTGTGYTLDNYEVGTWSPTQGAAITVNSGTYACEGYYCRIGDVVFVSMRQTSGNIDIGNGVFAAGLPFTADTNKGWSGTFTNGGPSTGGIILPWVTSLYCDSSGYPAAGQTSFRASVTYRV